MVTKNFSGNQGLTKVNTGNADLYVADATFVCNIRRVSDTQATQGGVVVRPSPADAKWTGGLLHGLNSGEDEYDLWATGPNGGAPFFFENSTRFTLEKIKIDGHIWDPVRPADDALNPVINACWFQDARDDVIEADHISTTKYVKVIDCLMLNVHTFISMRRGNSATGATPSHRVDFIRVIGSLAGWRSDQTTLPGYDRHKDSREKRKYNWNNTNHGSGQPWKFEGNMTNGTILLQDCVFMAPNLPKSSLSTIRLVPTNATLHSDSGGNVFVWLGSQTSGGNGGVDMVSVPRIGGGSFNIPEAWLGTGSEATRIRSVFTFTDSQSFWTDKVSNWQATIWEGDPPPPPPPDPVTANDDPGYDVQVGSSILVPVLSNDAFSGTATVSKVGSPTATVTTVVTNNQLQVTGVSAGTWSQTYRVTTASGQDDAVASGTVTDTPPPVTAQEIRPHDATEMELEEGALLIEFVPANVVVRQGIVSKDHQGFGDSHFSIFLENSTISVGHQDLPDVNLTLDAPGIEPSQEYELIFRWGAEGTKLYINRVRVDEQSTAWNTVGNLQSLVIGADNSASSADTTDALRDPFQGSVDLVEFLTEAEFNNLLGSTDGGSPGGGSPNGGGGTPPLTSVVTGNLIPLEGVVPESAFRANWAAAKSELEFLGATGTADIDTTVPADGVPADKADIRANFAAIKAAIQSVGSPGLSSAIDATKPIDGVPASRRAIRAIFDVMRQELDVLLAGVAGSPGGDDGSPVGSPGVTIPALLQSGLRSVRSNQDLDLTPEYPTTDLVAGERFLCHVSLEGDSGSLSASGTGWTEVESVNVGGLANFVFTQVADGSESGAATFDWSALQTTIDRTGAAAIYRCSACSINDFATTNGTGTTITFPSLTLAGDEIGLAFVSVNGLASSESSPTSTWTFVARDVTESGGDLAWFLYEAATSPTNGTLAQNAGDRWSVVALALGPVGSP